MYDGLRRTRAGAVGAGSIPRPPYRGARRPASTLPTDIVLRPMLPNHPRALELIRRLDLEAHPEGGFFRRIHRSALEVAPKDGRGTRRAFSAIFYLLAAGDMSRWHRVTSDEAWHFHEGDPLELLCAPPDGGAVTRHELGPVSPTASPVHVVPGGWWQAARPLGAYGLVSCSVGPGFEYEDFTLLASMPERDRPSLVPAALLHACL